MADIVIPGEISGRRYGFTISGAEPTIDERKRIDAILRQQEGAFAKDYEQKYGQSATPGQGSGFLNRAGEFGKGIGAGVVGTLENVSLGAAALLPQNLEDPTREFIRSTGYALTPQADIGLEDTIEGKLGQGLGSFATFGLASSIPYAGPIIAGLSGMGEASERAYAADATPEQRALATAFGAPIGLFELLPVKSLGFLKNNFSSYLGKIFLEGGIEGAQEAASELAQNLVEQGIYNPEKGTIEGTGESFGVGAGTGAIVQALLGLLPGKTRGGAATTTPDQAEMFPTEDLGQAPARATPDQAEMFPTENLGQAPAQPDERQLDLFNPEQIAQRARDERQLDLFDNPEQIAQRARDEAIAILREETEFAKRVAQTASRTASLDTLGAADPEEAKIAETAAEADRRAEEAALANKTAPAFGAVIDLPAFNDEEFDAQADAIAAARPQPAKTVVAEPVTAQLDLAAQKLAAEKLKSTVDAPQRDLFGGGTEDAVIESGNQPSDSVLEQGDTGADTGGGSSAGTGKADNQRLGDGQPPTADVGTGEGIQSSALINRVKATLKKEATTGLKGTDATKPIQALNIIANMTVGGQKIGREKATLIVKDLQKQGFLEEPNFRGEAKLSSTRNDAPAGAVAQPSTLDTPIAPPQLNIDNPAGTWLEGKIERAQKDKADAEPDTYKANLGNSAGVTGWFEKPLNLDPKMLAKFKGAMGEEKIRTSSPKLKRLQKDIAEEGYKPEAILIHVREDGTPFIVDGNHRVTEAAASGRQSIPVEIKYLRGAEAVDGPLNPSILSGNAAADGTEITTALLDTWGVPKLAPAYKAVENREEDTIIRAELRKLVNNEYFKGNKEAIRNFLDEEPTLFDLAAADAAQEGSDPTASLMQAPTPKAPELGQTGLDFNAPAPVETKGQPFLPLLQTQGGTEQRLLPVQTIGTGYYAQTEDGQDESIGGTELLSVESLAGFNERIKRDKLEPTGVVAPFKPSAGTGPNAAPGGPTPVGATFKPVFRGMGREVPVDVQKLVKKGKVTPAQYDAIEANMERQANAVQTAKLRELWDKQWPMPTAAELEVAIGKFLDANPDRREAYSTVNLANYKPNDLLDHPRLALEFFIAENDRTEVDPTTSRDKKRIVNLLAPRQGDVAKGQSKEDRTEARHAKTYFGKYARPVDAFWHIAADVKAKRTGYRDAKNKEQSDLDKADESKLQALGLSDKLSAAESVFFKGTSQSNAEAAMRWVNKNLSPEAQFEIKKFLNLEGGGERRLKNRRIIDIAKGAAGQDRARVTEDQRNQLQEQIAAEGLLQNALSNTLAIRLALQAVYSKEEIDYLRYEQRKTPRKGKEANVDYVLRDFQERTGIDPEKLTDNEVIGVYDDYIFQNLTYPRQRLEELGAAYANATAGKVIVKRKSGADQVQGLRAAEIEKFINDIKKGSTTNSTNARIYSMESMLDEQLHPGVIGALRNGDIKLALRALERTAADPIIASLARRLIPFIGDLKIVFKNGVTFAGQPALGIYDGATNTATLNDNMPISANTLLHEIAHAATATEIAKPNSPVRAQLEELLNDVRERLIEEGQVVPANVDEFIAESMSNPAFRKAMARIHPKGKTLSALDRFLNTVGNFLRRIIALPTKDINTAMDVADTAINSILAPSAASRDVGIMPRLSTPQGVKNIISNLGAIADSFVPMDAKAKQRYADDFKGWLNGASDVTKNVLLGLSNFHILTDVAVKYNIIGAFDLGKVMRELGSSSMQSDQEVDGVLKTAQTWVKKNPQMKATFDRIVTQSTIWGVLPGKSRDQAVLAYGKDKKKFAKWEQLNKEWNKNLNKEGRELYNLMRSLYEKQYNKLRDAIFAKIDYATAGNPELAKRLKLGLFAKLFQKNTMEPYFPLARRGRYWIEYNARTENGIEVVKESFAKPMERDRAMADLQAEAALPGNPSNLSLNRDGTIEGLTKYNGNDIFSKSNAPDAQFVQEIVKLVKAKAAMSSDPKIKDRSAQLEEEIVNLFIDALPETSFFRSLQRRKNTPGYIEDSIDAMRVKGYSLGRQAARYEKSIEMRSIVDNLKSQLRYNADETKASVIRELIERANMVMYPTTGGFERAYQAANRTAFLYTLGFNASSAIVNLSSIPIVVLPYLAGRYGYAKTAKAMQAATGLYMGSGFNREVNLPTEFMGNITTNVRTAPSIDNYFVLDAAGKFTLRTDIELHVDPVKAAAKRKALTDIIPLLEMSMREGQLNRSIFYDAAGLEDMGRARSMSDKIQAAAGSMFHQVERFNRQVTLVAAYNLEMEKLAANTQMSLEEKQTAAAEKAIYQATESGGGATMDMAPRYAQQGFTRVALMFKNYGMTIAYMQIKMIKQLAQNIAPGNDAESKALRNMAMKQLLGLNLSAGLLAGVGGMPIYGVLSTMADLLLLDDDEEDADMVTRRFLTEGWYKGWITELTGMDFAARVGLNDLLFRSNRYNNNPSEADVLMQQIGGPAWSTGTQIWGGLTEFATGKSASGGPGDRMRGLENMMPASVRNVLKTGRFAYDGMEATTRRRDPIIDDMSFNQLMGQFFGFAPAELSLQQEINSQLTRISTTLGQRRTNLMRRYYAAVRFQDTGGMQEIAQEIQDFNSDVGTRFPKAILNGKTLRKSLTQNVRTTAKMHNGITLNPLFENELRLLAQLYNQ
jgi:hypothetical protein